MEFIMVRAGFLFDWIELHLESKQGMKFFATVLVSFFVFAIDQAFNLLLALIAPIIIGAVIGVGTTVFALGINLAYNAFATKPEALVCKN